MSAAGGGGERMWYSDPRGFLRDDRLTRFIPSASMTFNEQLNAMMRFALYYTVLLLLLRKGAAALYVVVIAGGATFLLGAADVRRLGASDGALEALDVMRSRDGRTCTAPTRHNPFMNVLYPDHRRFPRRPPACDLADPAVSQRVEAHFDHNLYRDADDVFDRRVNSRQWYTNPATTIPNDQGAFARWLYQTGPTCKEGNGDRCDAQTFRYVPGR
jgi:hypothetical protein